MKQVNYEKIKAFIDAAHQVVTYDLIRYSSGNLSARLEDDSVLISASRTWLGHLQEDQIAVFRLKDGQHLNDVKPSVEYTFHLGILRQRPDVNVVLHFQSRCATSIACGKPEHLNFFVIPEIPYYIGTPTTVDYFPPGSDELAEAVCAAAVEHDMIILKNHGLVTVGKNYSDLIQKAGFFELACEIILQQPEVSRLPDVEVKKLLDGGKV